jgi:hypothetical protein
MGKFTELFMRRKKTPTVTSAPRPAPTPEPPSANDPQALLDAELRERIAASHAALMAELARNGYTDVGFGSGPGGTRDERVDRIFRGWS